MHEPADLADLPKPGTTRGHTHDTYLYERPSNRVAVSASPMNPSQPIKPVLTPATFDEAVLRLAIATDAELAEWDLGLNAELKLLVEQIRRQAA